MSMDDRPNASIWGTVLSCIEIGLNIYQVVAERGRGVMIAGDAAKKLLSDKAAAQGETSGGFVHYAENSPGESATLQELIENGHITGPKVIEEYAVSGPEQSLPETQHPDSLPEPEAIPGHWGAIKEIRPVDNGVYFVSGEYGGGIAVHTRVACQVMSDYAQDEDFPKLDMYRYYALDKEAAIAVFELSASRPNVLDLITSWKSLMHTLAAEFPDYTRFWNDNCEPESMITDMPAPAYMFLQRQLDQAAALPVADREQDEDNFFETPDFFEQEP